ncbi:hypothetical protein [Acidicapsa ligni]|uniref:hypothetical protein n=1 Tax=Acidicapsa ligni TaxID=542300 RepID=UPI0021DF4D04|nr:hypothetical protein [Acidicapsa ligni]
MPEKHPGEPPNRWMVINDYSKTVVAVCAALLAFIGAASSKLLEAHLSFFATCIVIVTVGLLALSALCALAVPAMLDRYLCVADKGLPDPNVTVKNLETATQEEWDSRPKRIWKIKAAANFSYIFLALAVLSMALFATCRPFQDAAGAKPPAGNDARPAAPAMHYEIVYSAAHKTNHGLQVHTFLLNQSTGELWQMVCAADGLVSFRKLQRRDVEGNVVVEKTESPESEKLPIAVRTP